MKRRKRYLVLMVIFLLACSKGEDDPDLPPTALATKSNEKQLISFRFVGIENNGTVVDISGQIDEQSGTVDAQMPSGTDVTALEPEVEISELAVYEPTGPQDFTNPINYTVTAEDGTSRAYLVNLEVALTQKEILLRIAAANPGILNWKKEDSLSDWQEVGLDDEGNVISLEFIAKQISDLPPEIGALFNLRSLVIQDSGLSAIPKEIGQLSYLQRLDLFGNRITTLPAEIGLLEKLTELAIQHTSLIELPKEIGQLSNLESLSLGGNSLSAIPPEIGQLINLQVLGLGDNGLSSLPLEIWTLKALRWLFLNHNNLNEIPPEINGLTSLEILFLNNNSLSVLPAELGQLSNLSSLVLNNNDLNSEGILPLFRAQFSTSCSSSLSELYLIGNEGLRNLPGCICELDPLYGGSTDIDIVEEEDSWAECEFTGTGK